MSGPPAREPRAWARVCAALAAPDVSKGLLIGAAAVAAGVMAWRVLGPRIGRVLSTRGVAPRQASPASTSAVTGGATPRRSSASSAATADSDESYQTWVHELSLLDGWDARASDSLDVAAWHRRITQLQAALQDALDARDCGAVALGATAGPLGPALATALEGSGLESFPCSSVSRESFRTSYIDTGQPALVSGFTDEWPAVTDKLWTVDALRRAYRDTAFEVEGLGCGYVLFRHVSEFLRHVAFQASPAGRDGASAPPAPKGAADNSAAGAINDEVADVHVAGAEYAAAMGVPVAIDAVAIDAGDDDDAADGAADGGEVPASAPTAAATEWSPRDFLTSEHGLYVFDDTFEMGTTLLSDYSIPHYFEGPDVDTFSVLPTGVRPPYRWFLVGSIGSGSAPHVDPLGTSAWNALVTGRKRWVMLEPCTPRCVVLGIAVEASAQQACQRLADAGLLQRTGDDASDVSCSDSPGSAAVDGAMAGAATKAMGGMSALQWFDDVLPHVRAAATAGGYRMIEFEQAPGETVFVPGGWYHAVLNLDTAVAVTQNFAPASVPAAMACHVDGYRGPKASDTWQTRGFEYVWKETRDIEPEIAAQWLAALDAQRPALAARARLVGEVA